MNLVRTVLLFALALGMGSVFAREKVLSLHSARHHLTGEALYADFTKQSGIRLNADHVVVFRNTGMEGAQAA